MGSLDENHLFMYDGQQISKFDMGTKKIVSSVSNNFFSNWFISRKDGDLYTLSYSDLIHYDKNNLNIQSTIHPYDLGLQSFWSTTSISTNNRIGANHIAGIGYYDLNEHKLLFSQRVSGFDWFIFSPDGKYAYSTKYMGYADKETITIFEVSDSGMKIIGQLPENVYSQKIWIPGKDHKLMVLIGYQFVHQWGTPENTIRIWDAPTVTPDFDFKVKVGHYAGIDFQTRHLAVWEVYPNSDDKRFLYIYNFENGKMEKQINLAARVDLLTIWHSRVLSGDGFCLDYSKF